MTIAVRLFAYSGVRAMPWASNNQIATNAEYVAAEPYLGGEVLSAGTGAAVTSSAATAPDGTRIARVEVQRGYVVHYEVSPANATLRTATTSSPTLDGRGWIDFGPSYRISVLQATTEA